MRRVHLRHLEADRVGTARRLRERSHHRGDVIDAQLTRRRQRAERDRRGSDHVVPAAVFRADVAAALPRLRRRRLATGVRELDAGNSLLVPDEGDDPLPGLGLLVVPDAGVRRRDPTLGGDRRGLGEHQSGASPCERPEVHEVPVLGYAVHGRVLAHRRDEDAVAEGRPAQGQGREQVRGEGIVGHDYYVKRSTKSRMRAVPEPLALDSPRRLRRPYDGSRPQRARRRGATGSALHL